MTKTNTIAESPAMDFALQGQESHVQLASPSFAMDENRDQLTQLATDREGSSYQAPIWKKNLDKAATWSSWVAFASNLLAAPMILMKFSDKTKKFIEASVNNILNMSFVFYGASGVANGKEKKNIFMMLGFLGEMIFPWFGSLKYTYLLRGLPTALDQLWVATDPRLKDKFKDGIFPDIKTGFKEVSKMLGTLTKEFIQNPLGTILTKETKGHHAFLSSVGSALASIGYMLTGKEGLFGPLRDLSGPLFDWAMLATKNKLQNISGIFFMFESVFDFVARVFDGHYPRIACNMLSHACGRFALELYKNSDSVATVKI